MPCHPVSVASDEALAGLLDTSRCCVLDLSVHTCAPVPVEDAAGQRGAPLCQLLDGQPAGSPSTSSSLVDVTATRREQRHSHLTRPCSRRSPVCWHPWAELDLPAQQHERLGAPRRPLRPQHVPATRLGPRPRGAHGWLPQRLPSGFMGACRLTPFR
jgi:hypothetical protein